MKNIRFSVRGSGKFPITMLARGGCHPSEEEDAQSMADYTSLRTINLVGFTPSDDSWRAFGWSIVKRPPIMTDDYNIYHTWPC